MQYETIYHYLNQFLSYYIIIFMVLELAYLLFYAKDLLVEETKINMLCGFTVIITQTVLKTGLLASVYPTIYAHRILNIGNGLGVVAYCVFLFTFLQFVVHYLNHKVRLFWCLHEVHHSATRMNSTTGIRNSIFDVVSTDALYFLIPFLGVPPLIFLIVYGSSKIWGNFIHINEKLVSQIPFVNWILVDPAGHHIHHARNLIYLDKNYGELTSLYDRLFKTYMPLTEKPEFGTFSNHVITGFWDSQLYEFKRLYADVAAAKDWKQKLQYVFMPPGWLPEGRSQTTRYMQRAYFQQNTH
jgi:sterol desaturase/sphingolipid hydroxylase (fatty acid hydroxylase superfamily)